MANTTDIDYDRIESPKSLLTDISKITYMASRITRSLQGNGSIGHVIALFRFMFANHKWVKNVRLNAFNTAPIYMDFADSVGIIIDWYNHEGLATPSMLFTAAKKNEIHMFDLIDIFDRLIGKSDTLQSMLVLRTIDECNELFL